VAVLVRMTAVLAMLATELVVVLVVLEIAFLVSPLVAVVLLKAH
jgi:hypothetical protein